MTDESATPRGVLEKVDWEAVERLYRAGVLSIREIAKIHGCSDTAIRKKAKLLGWARDLTEQVREQMRAELVRAPVRTRTPEEAARTERQILAEAVSTVVQVVREHRVDIASGRNMAALLMCQLGDVAGNRETFETAIEEATEEDKTTERRNKLMRAISLPTHAAMLRDLSNAMKNFVTLERQAFNITEGAEDAPAGPAACPALAGFANLQARFDKVLGPNAAAAA